MPEAKADSTSILFTNENDFIQEDEVNGTDFISNKFTLHSTPVIGYAKLDTNTPGTILNPPTNTEVTL